MTKNKGIHESSVIKNFSYREISFDNYLVYAPNSELLCVGAETLQKLNDMKQFDNLSNVDYELFEILKENNFIHDEKSDATLPSQGNKILTWIRHLFLLFAIVSLAYIVLHVSVLYHLPYNIFAEMSQFRMVLIGAVFSFGTTILHEVMHAYFANNLRTFRENLTISFKKSVATVNLTHIWLWPMYPRLMAIFSGIGIDIILLAILITVSKHTSNSLITLLIYILLLRIIWQMRPLQKTDSSLFILMCLDNPFLIEDYLTGANSLNRKEKFLCIVLRIANFLVNVLILLLLGFLIFNIKRYV